MFIIFEAINVIYKFGGISVVDWGIGDAQYKKSLGSGEWTETTAHIFAPSSRGVLLSALRVPLMVADRVLRDALMRFNIVDWIKAAWRKRLRPQ
jgi:hypothetical protein